MSRARRAAGAAAMPCGLNVLQDEMPELVAIQPAQFDAIKQEPIKPVFEAFRLLLTKNEEAMALGRGSMSDDIKKHIIAELLTEEVKAGAREIFSQMFGGKEGISDPALLDCILKANINELPLPRSIQMVGTLCSKAFYKNNPFRILVAGSFVGSVFYVSWVSGMREIFGLGVDGCKIVFSALAACHHLISNPNEFMLQFEHIIGQANLNSIAGFIECLKENLTNPTLFAGLVAQSNVALIERIFPRAAAAGAAPASDAAAGAAAAPPPAADAGPSHLENLRDAIQAAIAVENAKSPQTQDQQLLARLNKTLAETKDAIDAAAAAALAPAAIQPTPLYKQMFAAVQNVAGLSSDYMRRYITSLFRYVNKVRHIFPGVAGENNEAEKFFAYSCNLLNYYVTNVFDAIKGQMVRAGINERETILATLLDYILPSALRNAVFMGQDYNASQEMILLAFRLKDSIIDCYTQTKKTTREVAKEHVEKSIPFYMSDLTNVNVQAHIAGLPSSLLEGVLKSNQPKEVSESQDSTRAQQYDSQPTELRLESVRPDLVERFRKEGDGVFFTDEERKELERTSSMLKSILNVNPFSLFTKKPIDALKCRFIQDVVGRDITLFEKPAQPRLLSSAHTKFLPLERLFSSGSRAVFQHISEMVDDRRSIEEIRQSVAETFNLGKVGSDQYNNLIKSLLLGFKLEALWSPTKSTFEPAIVYEKDTKRPMAVMVLDIESTDTEVKGAERSIVSKSYTVPCELVTEEKSVSAISSIFGFFYNRGSTPNVQCRVPAAPVSEVVPVYESQSSVADSSLSSQSLDDYNVHGGPDYGVSDQEVDEFEKELEAINPQQLADDAIKGSQGQPTQIPILSEEQQSSLSEMIDRAAEMLPPPDEVLTGIPDKQNDFLVGMSDAVLKEQKAIQDETEQLGKRVRDDDDDDVLSSDQKRTTSETNRKLDGSMDKGGARRTHRRHRSSKRVSTTRGRKGASRRKQSKKRKQMNSRRRRSSRKATRGKN